MLHIVGAAGRKEGVHQEFKLLGGYVQVQLSDLSVMQADTFNQASQCFCQLRANSVDVRAVLLEIVFSIVLPPVESEVFHWQLGISRRTWFWLLSHLFQQIAATTREVLICFNDCCTLVISISSFQLSCEAGRTDILLLPCPSVPPTKTGAKAAATHTGLITTLKSLRRIVLRVFYLKVFCFSCGGCLSLPTYLERYLLVQRSQHHVLGSCQESQVPCLR